MPRHRMKKRMEKVKQTETKMGTASESGSRADRRAAAKLKKKGQQSIFMWRKENAKTEDEPEES